MILPGILAYILNHFLTNKTKMAYKILFLIFISICFLKSSTTFLLGTVLSLLILTLFNYRNFNIKVLTSYLIIIFLFSYILVTNKECSSRFVPIYSINIYSTTNENIIDFQKIENNANQREKSLDKIFH